MAFAEALSSRINRQEPDIQQAEEHEAMASYQPLDPYVDDIAHEGYGADYHKAKRRNPANLPDPAERLTAEQRDWIAKNKLAAILRRAEYWKRVGQQAPAVSDLPQAPAPDLQHTLTSDANCHGVVGMTGLNR